MCKYKSCCLFGNLRSNLTYIGKKGSSSGCRVMNAPCLDPLLGKLWNELSQSKKDKMADGSPKGVCVSHSPSIGLIFAGREQVISRRPDLEVDLERTQNYFVESSALYPHRMII